MYFHFIAPRRLLFARALFNNSLEDGAVAHDVFWFCGHGCLGALLLHVCYVAKLLCLSPLLVLVDISRQRQNASRKLAAAERWVAKEAAQKLLRKQEPLRAA